MEAPPLVRHPDVPAQITCRILASLASLSIVKMVARVMPMYGMNSKTAVGRGRRERGQQAEGEEDDPAAPRFPA